MIPHTQSASALVPVFTGDLSGHPQQLCNARDLHAVLGVGCDYSTWIKRRIEEYDFAEGEDYSSNLGIIRGRGQPRTDYHLTLSMAKELAMLENNDIGREVRRYFIRCEAQALAAVPPAPTSVLPATPTIRQTPCVMKREDLSFVSHTSERITSHWKAPFDPNALWSAYLPQGEQFFVEVAALAEHNEHEACLAIELALVGSHEFQRGADTEFRMGRGIETGFVRALARAAIDGLRARQHGATPFDPEARKGRR